MKTSQSDKSAEIPENSILKFIRQRDYKYIKELGQGACGRTVLLYDEEIDEKFVCKKYSPYFEDQKEILFKNFLHEIKLLHLIHHPNLVRVFNYYVYHSDLNAYILMEHVNGNEIDAYIKQHPQNINEVFFQAIEGFSYLEKNQILHRDIRPQNILINEDGILKIIDFGFGKKVHNDGDYDKSISLNWWCEPPADFKEKQYNFLTEVYFVGKLFEKLIEEHNIEHFKYKAELKRMCKHQAQDRIVSFEAIKQSILQNRFTEIDFSILEKNAYRNFSKSLAETIIKIEQSSKYHTDAEKTQQKLEDLYKTVMLEEVVPNNPALIKCFVSGEFYYKRQVGVSVDYLKNFIQLLRSSSKEKINVILSNLFGKLDSIVRYENKVELDDEIPF